MNVGRAILFGVWLLSAGGGALRGAETATLAAPELLLTVTGGTAAERQDVLFLVRQSQELLQEILQLDKPWPALPLGVVLGEGALPAPPALGVRLPDDLPPVAALSRLDLAVVERLLLARRGGGMPPGAPTATEWLAAALNRRHRARLLDDRTPLAALLPVRPGDRLPRVEDLTQLPVGAEWPAPFELYARHCDLLLSVLQANERPGEGRVRRVLELQAAGRPARLALELVYADRLGAGQGFQEWFEKQAAALLRRQPPRVLAAAGSAARLEAILAEREAARRAGEGTRAGTYPWERLLQAPPPPATAVAPAPGLPAIRRRTTQAALLELMRAAPPPLQPSLLRIANLCGRDAIGAEAASRDDLDRALAAFRQACAFQEKVERYLEELAGMDPASQGLMDFLARQAAEQERRQRALAPGLAAWLDGVERP
ncbi:MAG: hypothetical protein WC789_03045 [Lentisphaeria bacterium]|jgi:hypothetical protein